MKSQELLSALPAEVKHTDPDVVSAATGGYSVLNSSKGTLYRGRWGMWSWVAHRVTGIAIFFFLLVHVLDTAVVRISPEAYNSVLGLYKNPVMGLGETALVAAIVYHAFKVEHVMSKGKDCSPEINQKATYPHIKILWVVLFLWAITVAGFAARHLPIVFSHLGGH